MIKKYPRKTGGIKIILCQADIFETDQALSQGASRSQTQDNIDGLRSLFAQLSVYSPYLNPKSEYPLSLIPGELIYRLLARPRKASRRQSS